MEVIQPIFTVPSNKWHARQLGIHQQQQHSKSTHNTVCIQNLRWQLRPSVASAPAPHLSSQRSPPPHSRDQSTALDHLPSHIHRTPHRYPAHRACVSRSTGKGRVVRYWTRSLLVPVVNAVCWPKHCAWRAIGSFDQKSICGSVIDQRVRPLVFVSAVAGGFAANEFAN